MSKDVKIEKIVIKMGEKELSLSLDEAKELLQVLKDTFGEMVYFPSYPIIIPQPYPVYPPVYPIHPFIPTAPVYPWRGWEVQWNGCNTVTCTLTNNGVQYK